MFKTTADVRVQCWSSSRVTWLWGQRRALSPQSAHSVNTVVDDGLTDHLGLAIFKIAFRIPEEIADKQTVSIVSKSNF